MNDNFKKAMDLSIQEGVDPISLERSGIVAGSQQPLLPTKSSMSGNKEEKVQKAEALKPLIP
jgi:hypothetical protein